MRTTAFLLTGVLMLASGKSSTEPQPEQNTFSVWTEDEHLVLANRLPETVYYVALKKGGVVDLLGSAISLSMDLEEGCVSCLQPGVEWAWLAELS